MGGADLGLDRAGWECAGQCEIDASAQKVLAKHWTSVSRQSDIRELKGGEVGAVDLLVGGFPCQDVSVAGDRAGLAGSRSGLWWEFHRLLAEVAPHWVCIENVPGLLSSNGGRDFGAILRSLAKLGYGVAWRVLDAQHFGVPQRRRRVFLVGCLGSAARAAAVLFESESVSGDSAKGRAARADLAGTLGGSFAGAGSEPRQDLDRMTYVPDVAFAVNTMTERLDGTVETLIARSLRANRWGGSDSHGDEGNVVLSFQERTRNDGAHLEYQEDLAYALLNPGDGGRSQDRNILQGMGVRRLTPVECLRLQGFPDDWLDGLGLSDSTKYRLCGNAIAVPVLEWIARRMKKEAGKEARAEAAVPA